MTAAPHDSAVPPVLPPVWGRSVRPAVGAGSPLQRTRTRVGYAQSDDGGFTLVEAVVSLTIFAIVAAAGVLALVTGIKGDNATNDRVAAAQIAQQELDRARAVPRASLTGTGTATTAVRGQKSYSVSRSLSYLPAGASSCPAPTAVPTGTAVNEVRIRIAVTIPGSPSRTVTMHTVLAC